MTLQIYNTLSKKKEVFKPLRKGKVGMYVCGPTVYHHTHVGNARPMVFFDVVFRYLKFKGYKVTYVRNVTDIDDKIIKRSIEEKQSASDVAKTYERAFQQAMAGLGLTMPNKSPRATEHIADMITWIKALIDKGYAYQVKGEVFYAIEVFKEYGKLSKSAGGIKVIVHTVFHGWP